MPSVFMQFDGLRRHESFEKHSPAEVNRLISLPRESTQLRKNNRETWMINISFQELCWVELVSASKPTHICPRLIQLERGAGADVRISSEPRPDG